MATSSDGDWVGAGFSDSSECPNPIIINSFILFHYNSAFLTWAIFLSIVLQTVVQSGTIIVNNSKRAFCFLKFSDNFVVKAWKVYSDEYKWIFAFVFSRGFL